MLEPIGVAWSFNTTKCGTFFLFNTCSMYQNNNYTRVCSKILYLYESQPQSNSIYIINLRNGTLNISPMCIYRSSLSPSSASARVCAATARSLWVCVPTARARKTATDYSAATHPRNSKDNQQNVCWMCVFLSLFRFYLTYVCALPDSL